MNAVTMIIITIVAVVVAVAITLVLSNNYHKTQSRNKIGSAEEKAREIIDEAVKNAEAKKREAMLEAKEDAMKQKNEADAMNNYKYDSNIHNNPSES